MVFYYVNMLTQLDVWYHIYINIALATLSSFDKNINKQLCRPMVKYLDYGHIGLMISNPTYLFKRAKKYIILNRMTTSLCKIVDSLLLLY